MIPDDDFCCDAVPTKGRPQVVSDEGCLFGCFHLQTWIVVGILWFILYSYRINPYTLTFHLPDVLHKIAGIDRVIFTEKAATNG